MSVSAGQNRNSSEDRAHRVLIPGEAWSHIALTLNLTPRELQIFQEVFAHTPDKAIASRLRLSPHTVHGHLNRIFKKLRVTTRSELVLLLVHQYVQLTRSDHASLPPICRHRENGRCKNK